MSQSVKKLVQQTSNGQCYLATRNYEFSLCVFFVLACPFFLKAFGDDLPSDVPRPIGPDGKYTHALIFTTKAYREAAFTLLIQEANHVAIDLGLPEGLPIVKSNVINAFINPFGYAYAKKAVGNITTSNYVYYVSRGNRLSYVDNTHQDELCRQFQASYTLPVDEINTNEALALATHWLAAIPTDMAALQSNCTVTVALENVYVHPRAGTFVPVYYVSWSEKNGQNNGVASVRLFTPSKTLLQLRVEDPKYILRPPIVFTNLAELLSTNTVISTIALRSP